MLWSIALSVASAWWSVCVLIRNFLVKWRVRHRSGIFVSEHLMQLVYLFVLEFGALIRTQGLCWARNYYCSLDDGMGYLLCPLLYYAPVTVPQTVLGSPSSREYSYIPTLRLKWKPIGTLPSQPIFFRTTARQENDLLRAVVCCLVFFVFDKLGISCTILARRDF